MVRQIKKKTKRQTAYAEITFSPNTENIFLLLLLELIIKLVDNWWQLNYFVLVYVEQKHFWRDHGTCECQQWMHFTKWKFFVSLCAVQVLITFSTLTGQSIWMCRIICAFRLHCNNKNHKIFVRISAWIYFIFRSFYFVLKWLT